MRLTRIRYPPLSHGVARTAFRTHSRCALLLASVLASAGGHPACAQDDPAALPRLVVGYFDGDETPWRLALRYMVMESLRQVPGLVVDESAANYALRAMGREPRSSVERLDALLEFGRTARADFVLVGRCEQLDPGSWSVDLRMVGMPSGDPVLSFTVRGDGWAARRDGIVTRIAAVFAPDLGDAELERALRPLARDPRALDALAAAIDVTLAGRAVGEIAQALNAVLDIERDNVRALVVQGDIAQELGRFEEADMLLKRARRLAPGDPSAEVTTALLLTRRGNLAAARVRLARASAASPRWDVPLRRWGEVLELSGEWAEVAGVFERACVLAPCRANVRVTLGVAYAQLGDRARALEALAAGLQIRDGDRDALARAARAYDLLRELRPAIDTARRLAEEARAAGIDPDQIARLERYIAGLEAKLVCHRLPASRPRAWSKADLESELHSRLADTAIEAVECPYDADPELVAWARDITAGTDGPLAAARALFEELHRPIRGLSGETGRSLRQIRDAWGDPDAAFCTHDLGILFVAMARACGVDADLVHVDRDPDGRLVDHDCAAIHDGEAAILVDVGLGWFGAPHRDFTILDDLQATAHFLLQNDAAADLATRVERARAGVALHPDSAWARARLAVFLIGSGRLDEAEGEFDVADGLQPGRWDTLAGRASLANFRGQLERADELLAQAIGLRPDDGQLHSVRANVLGRQGRWPEAVASLRRALELATDRAVAASVRQDLERAQRRLDGR